MQQIFIQVVIRFLGLLEYYNSNFIAVTITFNNNLFNWWSDPKEVSKNEFSYIFIFTNILHYANSPANNKMQLTLNELQKRSFKQYSVKKSCCGLRDEELLMKSKNQLSYENLLYRNFPYVTYQTGIFYHEEFIW